MLAMPPDAMTGCTESSATSSMRKRSVPASCPSRCTAVTRMPPSGTLVQSFNHVEDGAIGRARPSARHHPSLAHVGGDDQLLREGGGGAREPLRLLERAGAEHNPLRALAEEAFDRVAAPNAATHLHVRGHLAQDVPDDGGVVAARRGGIEVDHVQAGEAGAGPAARHLHGILESNSLVGVRSPHQLDARAVAHVDCGNGDHACTSCKNV